MEREGTLRCCLAALRRAWHPNRMLAAVILGGSYTLITYPGIWYSDSYARAARAAMIAGGQALDTINTYLSIIPQFFIAFCLELTSNFAAYTWLQAFLLLWGIIEFSFTFFRGRARWIVCGLFMVSPLIMGYSVYWEMGVLAAACLLWLLLLDHGLEQQEIPLPGVLRALLILLYGFLVFAMVGARLNAFTAAAGLFLWTAVQALRNRRLLRRLLPKLLAIAAGAVLAFTFPALLGMSDWTNGAVGFSWEMANIINAVGPGQGYDDYMDDILMCEGVTKTVFDVPLEAGTASMYSYHLHIGEASAINKKLVYKKYAALALAEPAAFCKVKAAMIRNDLKTLPFYEYDYDRDRQMSEYGFSDTAHRRFFHSLVTGYMQKNAWLRTPWLLFTLAGALCLAAWRFAGAPLPAAKLIFVAACYYGAFFITAQSFEFRYFFPACLLLLFSCLLSAQALLPRAWNFCREKLMRKEG